MLSTANSWIERPQNARSVAREGFFLEASKAVRQKLPSLILMLTGGFRSRQGIENALVSNSCDLVGLGRPAVKHPELPLSTILNEKLPDEDARLDVEKAPSLGWIATKIPALGAGAETV
jgi:2,4-dienoyl-CoA reductase-like NADH-dependent reductase (Old Yellow Enzyme family)